MARLENLPIPKELETKSVLRAASRAHRFLGELKGAAATIPNQNLLIDTLSLQEAKDSSEVESIITTHDELYQDSIFENLVSKPAVKEVRRYAVALQAGFHEVARTGLIREADVLEINQKLTLSESGYRKVPGTVLRNDQTGEVVYEPPQDALRVQALMGNLVTYINDSEMCSLDPLVKMAVIHHQFESIHPFYDGNGRTGRILNILYLVASGLLDQPIFYLSRYIVQNKADYYRLLQLTRDTGEWEPWLLFMLEGVAQTAHSTLQTVRRIVALMSKTKHLVRKRLEKIYSQDLINLLFRWPYTRIEALMEELQVSRPTASKYLQALVEENVLREHVLGRSKFFVNEPLFEILMNVEGLDAAS